MPPGMYPPPGMQMPGGTTMHRQGQTCTFLHLYIQCMCACMFHVLEYNIIQAWF